MMPMLQMGKYGFIWMQWMTKKNKNRSSKNMELIKKEIDRLIDSLDFEPANAKEVLIRISRLMCLL